LGIEKNQDRVKKRRHFLPQRVVIHLFFMVVGHLRLIGRVNNAADWCQSNAPSAISSKGTERSTTWDGVDLRRKRVINQGVV